MNDYGLCPVCDQPMTFEDDADVDLHSMPDGSDCHAECCPTCSVPAPAPDEETGSDSHDGADGSEEFVRSEVGEHAPSVGDGGRDWLTIVFITDVGDKR